ncbi:hypothetical protein D3C76_1705210 [compost metagenome]
MPTKDQIAQMMNYDLARRADRTHLSLIAQAAIAPAVPAEKPATKTISRPSRPVIPVAGESAPSVHFSKGEDVQTQLEQRGWVDKDSAW